jgi:DNA invertase Pin-like site-specific DNA recombinase
MSQRSEKIKYFLYARKSSESEDRQVQSIDDQVNRLKQLAKDLNLDIKKIYIESKSAKKPNNREIFNEMLERIENGEADGILCWQINRLFRNPIDSGRIGWLLQQSVIKSIQTMERNFLPEDNVLLFSVESGMANQYILDLRKNVTRGLESKREKGWLPGMPPQGYLNDRQERTIIKDPERFNLIRKMWDLMLTGGYTPPKILEIVNNEWGYRTRKFRKIGNKEMSRSGIYKMFTNIFYTGIIEDPRGRQYQGKHEAIITLEEFDRVQILLGRKGKPRPKTHEFAFTGMIRCEECGCLYTAETKRKTIKSTGKVSEFTYYHCTRKKKNIDCSQRKWMRVKDLELQIEKEIEKYTILPEFRDWALEHLSKSNDTEIEDRSKIYEMQHQSLVKTQKELDNLTQMRYRDLINDETFIKEKGLLQNKIFQFKEKLRGTETRAERWLELTEKTFNFATYARSAFIKGNMQTKKEILMSLGQNPTILNGKIFIRANEWLIPIKNDYPKLKFEYEKSEPHKNRLDKRKTETIASIRLRWLGLLNEIRTFFEENPDSDF